MRHGDEAEHGAARERQERRVQDQRRGDAGKAAQPTMSCSRSSAPSAGPSTVTRLTREAVVVHPAEAFAGRVVAFHHVVDVLLEPDVPLSRARSSTASAASPSLPPSASRPRRTAGPASTARTPSRTRAQAPGPATPREETTRRTSGRPGPPATRGRSATSRNPSAPSRRAPATPTMKLRSLRSPANPKSAWVGERRGRRRPAGR